jgi:hypothetical protein
MAGSYRHITNSDGSFRGTDLIENLGDLCEALEECHDMIQYLSGGDRQRIFESWLNGHLARVCPSNTPKQTFDGFWED